jgi:hypothetical protein
MPEQIELSCRLCNAVETFESVESVKQSEWTGTSPLAVLKNDGVRTHNSYCPDCNE